MTGKKLIIAGGGTGGHIFPGLAIAEAWQKRGGQVLWVGSAQGREKTLVPDFGITLKIIASPALKGKGLGQKLKSVAQLPIAIWKSLRLLQAEKPDVVIGVGGYVSFPVTLAAWLKRVPCAITDQNSYAGLANRVLGRFVKKVFLSFEDDSRQFSARKTEVVGNPIRSTLQREKFPAALRPFCLFATGGSLGAVALNQNFCAALDLLKPRWPDLTVIHQTGDTGFAESAEFYRKRPELKARCEAFLKDMAACYKSAHLILCRAGASTATEIALIGRPCLFVPYPFAADDHQTKNAQYFVKRQAAWMIPQTQLSPQKLAAQIADLMDHPEVLQTTAENMANAAKPGAAAKIAEGLLRICTKT